MSEKINMGELKVMIANEIKNEGLHEVLDNIDIDVIANHILHAQSMDKAKNAIPDVIPEQTEGPPMATSPINMPTPTGEQEVPTNKYYTPSADLASFGTGTTNSPAQIDQSTSGNIPAYTPELPSFLDKIEPGKIIVFDMNELSQGGENLSHKPFRTFEDPDVKKSMNDMWVNDGKRKADVYVAKFEKIGQIEFNYSNGTSQFIEQRFEPDFEAQAKYKENPYMAGAKPATAGDLDINGQPNIMNQIAGSVDIEKAVTNIVMNILRNQLLTNTTRAVNDNSLPKEEGFGYDTSQAVKPMEESTPGYAAYKMFKGDGDIQDLNAIASPKFDLDMAKLVDDNGLYTKADLPEELKEHIGSGEREFLKNENQEVEEWSFNGENYYLPKNRISKNKGYILKKN